MKRQGVDRKPRRRRNAQNPLQVGGADSAGLAIGKPREILGKFPVNPEFLANRGDRLIPMQSFVGAEPVVRLGQQGFDQGFSRARHAENENGYVPASRRQRRDRFRRVNCLDGGD